MIDEETAIRIARAAATENGWSFLDPVEAKLSRPRRSEGARWSISSNMLAFGAKARFLIDAEDGRITEQGYIPR